MATILIADDDANSRLLVATLLEHAGHVVLEAADGHEALKAAVEGRPDLILVDLSMPGMSGVAFIRTLRGDSQQTPATVVLYTGTADSEGMRDFMHAYGVFGIIPKPCEPAFFIGAVQAALNGAHQR